jgi:putative ABC transport system ATP-binding protein
LPSTPIAELRNVWKIYRIGSVEYPALRGVNLSIDRDGFISIIGPSESGKPTMLHLIGALDKPSKGEIYVDGIEISRLGDR